jgi:hypothetical protein
VFPRTCKIFASLIVVLLLGIGASSGWEYYPISSNSDFGNYCYLSFDEGTNFTAPPYQGISYDSTLVGYWNMGEGAGSVVYDNSGNGNNGTATGTTIVDGKYGAARYLDGNSYITVADLPSLHLGLTDFTISTVIKLDADRNGTYRTILRKGITGLNPFYGLRINPFDRVEFILRDSPEPAHGYTLLSTEPLPIGDWVPVTVTFDATTKICKLYINGAFNNQLLTENIGDVSSENSLVIGRASDVSDQYFKGTIDDVRVYNCTKSAQEVAALYTQPDPESFVNYYSYTDSLTNNAMTVNVDGLNENSNNVTVVTCTNFFVDNKLSFQANNSAIVNVWTNLGQPVFTTGVWNSQNYTTTLKLDVFSTAELNWILGTPPFASNFSATSTSIRNTTVFSALWSDLQSLSGGGYIFSNNNTGQWVNASWVSFDSNPCWGNVSLTLNSSVGVVVGFREFANDSLNLWGDSGIYAITTTNGTSLVTPTPTPSSAPTATPSPTSSTTTLTPTANPTTTPALQPETNQFPTQTVAIAAVAIAVLLAVFALALKKGYIKVEVVDEEIDENS